MLAEIGRLQIFTGLLPRRIAAKEADDAQAEESLTTATNEFIHQHLGPRVRKLAAQTREEVETELKPHFHDRAALLRAIAQSQRVRHIEALSWTASNSPAARSHHPRGKACSNLGPPPMNSKRLRSGRASLLHCPRKLAAQSWEGRVYERRSFALNQKGYF